MFLSLSLAFVSKRVLPLNLGRLGFMSYLANTFVSSAEGPPRRVAAPPLWQYWAERPRAHRRRTTEKRHELASPHIRSQAQETALYRLKRVL
jgi:hypothetical protein